MPDQSMDNSREMYSEYPFGNFEYGRFRYYKFIVDALRGASDKENKTIFDIGCGNSYFFSLYKELGFRESNISGLDQSTSAVSYTKDKWPDAHILQGDALSLPYNDGVADIAVSMGVIHHTSNPSKAFGELARITKQNGLIVLNVYNTWHPYFLFMHKLTFPIRHLYWNFSRAVFWPVFVVAYPAIQILSAILFFRLLSVTTIKTLLMDQMFTPFAKTFTLGEIQKLAGSNKLSLIQHGVNMYGMMRWAIFKKNGGGYR